MEKEEKRRMISEQVKKIFKELKSGEQFYYIKTDGKLYIGVRCGYSDKYDEYEIFECSDYKVAKDGLIKKRKEKK
jgi:hypothetical protein